MSNEEYMNKPDGTSERELEEYRQKIKKMQEEYLEAKRKEREEEQKRKEQEKALREQAEMERAKRELESYQLDWTPRHKELYRIMTQELGIDERRISSYDLTGERGEKYKVLKQEFMSIPLDLGVASLQQIPYYQILWHGWILTIYKNTETNQWAIKYPVDFAYNCKLIIENDKPKALEIYMKNPLFPYDVLKGILKLQ